MNKAKQIYDNARKKSVKTNEIQIINNGKITRINKRKFKKFVIKSAVTVIAVIAALKIVPPAVDKVDHFFKVRAIAEESAMHANVLLAEADLNAVPSWWDNENSNEWNNDYSQIINLSEEDLYGFVQYLGYDEAEKVVQVLGYKDWDSYLSMNGYFDANGNPSKEVWENYEEVRLIKLKEESKQDGKRP